MSATVNTPRKRHGLMTGLAAQLTQGSINKSAIVARMAKAKNILATYAIRATGSKVNGWGESVEAYTVGKYEVQVRSNGQTSCNCGDWKTRRAQHGGFCKHSLAVLAHRDAGILNRIVDAIN